MIRRPARPSAPPLLVAAALASFAAGCAGPRVAAPSLAPPAADAPAVARPTDPPAEVVPGHQAAEPGAPAASQAEGAPQASGPTGEQERAPRPAPAIRWKDGDGATLRARALEAARRLLGTRPRLDCSGYVLSALAAAGVTVELPPARSRTESLFLASHRIAQPRPGDLVFFHRTHDRDRKKGGGNLFTHVGLVEAVDGTDVTVLHRGRRVSRIHMDLSRPSDPDANDPVRIRRPHDRPGTRYLSGELFAAFGELLPPDVTRMLQARRVRSTSARHPATDDRRPAAQL